MTNINDILELFRKKGYVIDTEPLFQNPKIKIYRIDKGIDKYVLKIGKIQENEKRMYEEKIKINERLSKKICDDGKCKISCIRDTLVCSNQIILIDNYLIELIKRYDSDLYSVIFNEKQLTDNPSYFQKSLKDKKYLLNFLNIATRMFDTLEFLHENKMAHGDIKPENIFVNISDDLINDTAIADLDTLCIGVQDENGNYQCRTEDYTALYSTSEYILVNFREDVYFDISIKQVSDIYAMSFVILMTWFGYLKFLDQLGEPKGLDFINNSRKLENYIISLSAKNKTGDEEKERVDNIQKSMKSLNGLIIGSRMILLETYSNSSENKLINLIYDKYIQKSIDNIDKIMLHQYKTKDIENTYNQLSEQKYQKTKNKYLTLKQKLKIK